MTDMIERLQRMLESGQDNLLLRFTLGKGRFEQGRLDEAAIHLHAALAFDAKFSNAWKVLGRVRLEQGDAQGARQAWMQGSDAARARGDVQVGKEIGVFLKRLDKQAASSPRSSDPSSSSPSSTRSSTSEQTD